jgi:hypothetical protein
VGPKAVKALSHPPREPVVAPGGDVGTLWNEEHVPARRELLAVSARNGQTPRLMAPRDELRRHSRACSPLAPSASPPHPALRVMAAASCTSLEPDALHWLTGCGVAWRASCAPPADGCGAWLARRRRPCQAAAAALGAVQAPGCAKGAFRGLRALALRVAAALRRWAPRRAAADHPAAGAMHV